MKRRFALSALVGLGTCLAQNALAANMPLPALAPAPPPLNWNGFYFGANASIPWTNPVTFTGADPQGAFFFGQALVPATMSASDIGWGLGPVFGYNWQFSRNWLLGVEGDIDWGELTASATQSPLLCGTAACAAATIGPLIPSSTFTSKINVNSLSTVRGRGGWIWNNPKSTSPWNMEGDFLFFGTGGVAWAVTSYTANINCPNTSTKAPPFVFGCPGDPTVLPGAVGGVGVLAPITQNSTKTGAVVGGGVEWMPTVAKGKMIWGIEYLYYRFNSGNAATGVTQNPSGAPFSASSTCAAGTACIPYTASRLSINDIRVWLLYHWN
jgi:outer membrane immunogenic protein